MRITSLELANFKSIKEYSFELGNLNLLMGLNGMGKSSFVQSILLLRQSPNLKKGELRLNDNLVKIGRGSDLFYAYSKTDSLNYKIAYGDDLIQEFHFMYEPDADLFKTKNETNVDDQFLQLPIFGNGFQYLTAERTSPVK